MADEKHVANMESVPSANVEEVSEDIARNYTRNDQLDMKRMGKKQELLRNFQIFTSIAFTSCVMGTWEILLASTTSSLTDGGLAGLWWQLIWCYVGQTFIVLSLSEMASMAPTAGGQYHWVSEFAPPRWQKSLSYSSGWLSTLAWQAFVATDSYINAALLQAMITLKNPDYAPKAWQNTLIMIAFVCGMGAFNIFFARQLAFIEGFFAVLHFIAWIAIISVLWAMTPVKQSAKAVFTEFTDNGGSWGSIGLTACVGQVGAMFTVVGSDASAHMAEEIRDASVIVPRSMWWSFILNIPPALIVLATYVFCMPDLDKTLAAPTGGFPIVTVFLNSTGSAGGATGLTALLLILLVIIGTSCMASTVRQTFAFARDNGMVFSPWLAKIDQRFRVPTNSVIFTICFTIVMSLINIGSTTAFNAFLSVSVSALMATYTISIACVLVKRLRGQPLPLARWRLLGQNAGPGDTAGGLGKYGPFVNAVALAYSLWSCFWSFWPLYKDPSPVTMNWAVVIFAGVMLIAGVAFAAHARKTYEGPVTKVRKLEGDTAHF